MHFLLHQHAFRIKLPNNFDQNKISPPTKLKFLMQQMKNSTKNK